MFSKKENLETFIGKNTHLKGNITTKGTLRLDGRVTGNVEADWLIIGEKALLKGDVSVGGVVIGGTLEGNVTAKESVEVKSKGRLSGDLATSKLLVIEGGAIDGKISMLKEGSKVIELDKGKLVEPQAARQA
jgi:cytoskeletal protein CcmA (bactofilin family)